MTASTPPHPFSDNLWRDVQGLVRRLDARQTLWLSSFLASQVAGNDSGATTVATASKVLIAFGGETGNSENLARRLAEQAGTQGIAVELADLAGLRARQLAKRRHLLLICSTHGDGDPPEPARPFFDALMAADAPALTQLRYAVLALGDSSYGRFCATGQQLDERLAALGAQRLAPRRDCDVDYETPARQWMDAVLQALPNHGASATAQTTPAPAAAASAAALYSKRQPLTVEVLDNIRLSAPHRRDPIHHLELALDAPGFPLSPGDAVGVLADNPPALVAAVLDATGLSGEQPVTVEGAAMPLVQALRERCDLTIPGQRLLETWAAISGSEELTQLLAADTKRQRAFLRSHQVRDLLARYPGRPDADALVAALRPLQPRLYDVANSLAAVADELHLTVQQLRYAFAGREEIGIASDYLLQLQPGDSLRIYPHPNPRFRLPAEPDAPLILIAAGTGIAPYRAFLQEIAAGERSHPCWLVFAEECFEEDFLYQVEWQHARRDGLLQRIDTVFHRDRPGHDPAAALLEHGDELLRWLRDAGHLYLCGDQDLINRCEHTLQTWFDRHSGADLSWKMLNAAKRIHRNGY